MKKTLMLAGFAAILAACNNNSHEPGKVSDSAAHTGHSSNATSKNNNPDSNAMQETMNRMMRNMHNIKSTGNIDIDFAAMMIEHHRGAVEMSKLALTNGSDPELNAFARNVINDQDKEINFMEAFISSSSKTTSPNSAAFQEALGQSMIGMMNDTVNPENSIDRDFATRMIPHHQSAVDMAKAYLTYGKDKGLITLCRNIMESQSKEIAWLKEWLEKK